MGDADGDCSVGYEVLQDACESGMYIEAEYFVFESSEPDFVNSFGDVTKDYIYGVFVLLNIGQWTWFHGRWRGQCASLNIPPCWLSLWRSCSVR